MNVVEPEVSLIAYTRLTAGVNEAHRPEVERWMEVKSPDDVETLTEFAGRSCYQSFGRPNPKTGTTEKYLNRTLFGQKHWSIAEHASATFYITGVSRAFTHELIRHRHLSYSQLSQRFVDESDANMVIPPAFKKRVKAPEGLEEVFPYDYDTQEELEYISRECAGNYKFLKGLLTGKGFNRKQASEAARAVLPNMAETRIVVTGNLRAWREFIDRRTAPDADAEMQEVASMIENKLHGIAPTVFP